MTREVIDNFEDHLQSIRTEWHVMKEKWFKGEMMDPVFEGTVRDFCTFDETMHSVHDKVQIFMRGVESLASGMTALSEGVASGLANTADSSISSDSCKLKEATNQIARADAPHSAIAKLRRDMHFNILAPVQNHMQNNRNLKVSLDIRRRRLIEMNSAKKSFEDVQKKNISQTDRKYLQAQSTFEAAKATFSDVDRHVFEWLYILEEYRGDILDSTLQTLKYLEYEFFASSAHAISTSLPGRMEFRPMVEMTPEHLEAQVEMELQKNEESEVAEATGAADTKIVDFSARLIDKKVKEDPADSDLPALPVDPLSLSSLLSQGFEEGPARRALRKHQNNTQAALDWLVNGQCEEEDKKKSAVDGVRMPTTVKRVQKLKAMRKAQADKVKDKEKRAAEEGDEEGDRGRSDSAAASTEQAAAPEVVQAAAPMPDLLDALGDSPALAPAGGGAAAVGDLLGFDEKPAVPTDFSKPLDMTSLPSQISFDPSQCEKLPLSAAVAAGIAQNRTGLSPKAGQAGDLGQAFAAVPDLAQPAQPSAGLPPGISPELLSTLQALAAQNQMTPEALMQAAAQAASAKAATPAATPSPAAGSPYAPASAPAAPAAPVGGGGWDAIASVGLPGGVAAAALAGLDGLDPLAGQAEAKPAPAAPTSGAASFDDLVNFTSPSSS